LSRVALIHVAAGRPSFIGCPVIVITVPGVKSVKWMPARVRLSARDDESYVITESLFSRYSIGREW
jgi:hypothetical protein